MTPTRHPLPETLISFASGTLPGQLSVIVACHMTMCRICARDIRRLEILGGLLLEQVTGSPLDRTGVDRSLVRRPSRPDDPGEGATRDHSLVASFLKQNQPLDQTVPWKPVAPGVQQYRIPLSQDAGKMRLLRLSPGKGMPRRARDSELALVLDGRFADGAGNIYQRGDVMEWTDGTGPNVTAAVPECVCLVSSEGATGSLPAPVQTIRDWARRRLPEAARLERDWHRPAALAASLALLAGIGLGWLIWGGAEAGAIARLVSHEGNRIVARDLLREVLDTLPSGKERRESLGGQDTSFGVRMTFRQEGDYCRQYQISSAPLERYAGIACRRGGEWDVRIQALVPPAPPAGQITPANGDANAAMDAVIGAWSSGDAIVGEDEAAIIGKGWRK